MSKTGISKSRDLGRHHRRHPREQDKRGKHLHVRHPGHVRHLGHLVPPLCQFQQEVLRP